MIIFLINSECFKLFTILLLCLLKSHSGFNYELSSSTDALSVQPAAGCKCLNGGTCSLNGTHCYCPNGYSGERCANLEPCTLNDCQDPMVCSQNKCICPDNKVCMPCSAQHCRNGGVCTDLPNGDYECKCPAGWTGRHCTLDVDECQISPEICLNGICRNEEGSYKCYCPPGFTGKHCDSDVDECLSQPCQNGATCHNKINAYECACPPGYMGINCEIDIDECASNPCSKGSTCIDRINNFACSCMPGMTGRFCEIDIDECVAEPCQHGGQCIDELGGFHCNCISTGYEGHFCELNIDECAANLCVNGAECKDQVNDYFCQCHPGFGGKNCDIDINECESNPCQYNGLCLERSNRTLYALSQTENLPSVFSHPFSFQNASGYECVCVPGIMGKNCEININECESNPCSNHGACNDGIDTYTCECDPGFEGTYCEVKISMNANALYRFLNRRAPMNKVVPGAQLTALSSDPCPGACGEFARCQVINRKPVCSCDTGFTGNPLARCYEEPIKPENPNQCTLSSECPSDKDCIHQKCEDPCVDACGSNTRCSVRHHTPVCRCKRGYAGDPFTSCQPIPVLPTCSDDESDCDDGSTTTLQPTNDGLTCKIPDGLDALVITLLNSGAQLAPGSLVNDDETIQAKCKNRNDEASDIYCFGGKWQGKFPTCIVFCDKSFLWGISTTYYCHQNGIQQEALCSPSVLPNASITVFCASGFRRTPKTSTQDLFCMKDGKLNEKRLPCEQYCGQLTPAHRSLTKNGFPIIPSEAPWHVAIFRNEDGEQKHICGGSIISPRLIITAAHCFWNSTVPTSPHLYRIMAGKQRNKYSYDSNEGLPQNIEVEKIHISDQYADLQKHFYADIALLKLKAPLLYNENVSSVCMYDHEGDSQDYVDSNIIGSITGYGSSGTLERLNMATLSNKECQSLDDGSTLAWDKFCLRNNNDNSTLCRGDSGGGFVKHNNGAFYLLGIVSYTPVTKSDCVAAQFIGMSNVRYMRRDLREVWEREIKNDQELF